MGVTERFHTHRYIYIYEYIYIYFNHWSDPTPSTTVLSVHVSVMIRSLSISYPSSLRWLSRTDTWHYINGCYIHWVRIYVDYQLILQYSIESSVGLHMYYFNYPCIEMICLSHSELHFSLSIDYPLAILNIYTNVAPKKLTIHSSSIQGEYPIRTMSRIQ